MGEFCLLKHQKHFKDYLIKDTLCLSIMWDLFACSMCDIFIIAAEADKHVTNMHAPCASTPVGTVMVPGKPVRPRGKQTFPPFHGACQ